LALISISLIIFLAVPIVLPIAAARARRRSRPLLAAALGILSALTLVGYACIAYFNLPLGDKRVAEFRCENGTEFVVHQTCNYSVEPYTTRFYYRQSPESSWNAFYMDHQDDRWFSGHIDFDEGRQKAMVRRGKETVASFDVATLAFTRGAHATTTNTWVLAQGAEPGDEINR